MVVTVDGTQGMAGEGAAMAAVVVRPSLLTRCMCPLRCPVQQQSDRCSDSGLFPLLLALLPVDEAWLLLLHTSRNLLIEMRLCHERGACFRTSWSLLLD